MTFTYEHDELGTLNVTCEVNRWEEPVPVGETTVVRKMVEVEDIIEVELEDGTIFTSEAINQDLYAELIEAADKEL